MFTPGNFEGELLLNGKPVTEEMMMKISSFVPQNDISFDQLTALEHLTMMVSICQWHKNLLTNVICRV